MGRVRQRVLVFVLMICGICAEQLLAQSQPTVSSVSGYVLDSASKEPLISATVVVKGTKLGAFTNKSGFFSIKNIPPGKALLSVSLLGYNKAERTIELNKGEAKKVTILLGVNSVLAQGVSVEADREVEKRQISISSVQVPIEQIKTIRIGGEADVFRALQYLPGVLSSSQISSGLFIRGGSPDQNLVLIDGSTVYNPSHLFGFISTFNPEAVKNVELIKGGYPAQYGGRMSAVLDLTQKDGNKEKFEGLASLGLISSRASLQGPIGDGSWFFGARRTYIDAILAAVPQDEDNPLPNFGFYDINAKITQILGPSDRIFASGFLSSDKLTFDNPSVDFEVGLGNRVGSIRWTHVFDEDIFSTVNLSGSRYSNGFSVEQSGFESKIENGIVDYTLKADVEWFATQELTAKLGYEGSRYTFSFLRNFSGSADSTAPEGSLEAGNTNFTVTDYTHSVYGQINYQITDLLSLQTGLRANYWDSSARFSLDPRIALRYQLTEDIAIKGAWGIFHQYLRLASLQDFSFFDTWLPTDPSVPSSNSTHYILSVETKPAENLEFNADVYYKTLNNISQVKQFQIEGKTVSDVFYNGNGEAYGIELFAQKKAGDFTGWIGYALGYVWNTFDAINYGERFHPKFDRRHDFKIVTSYTLSDSWDVGASFLFQSGQPYTPISSRVRNDFPNEGSSKSIIINSNRYSARLPNSHQLNLYGAHTFELFGLKSRFIIDVYNVYSRRDIWFRYYDTTKEITEANDVRLLPILPTVSLEVNF